MVTINLLPITNRQAKYPVKQLLLFSTVLLLIIFSTIYSYSVYQVWTIEKQLQDIHNQYQLLQPTQLLMIKMTDQQQVLAKKNNILTTLTKERPSWYAILKHLATVTPPEICFTELIKSDKATIKIKGWTTTYPIIGECIQTLEQYPFFTEVSLKSIESDTISQITKFEIMIKPKGLSL